MQKRRASKHYIHDLNPCSNKCSRSRSVLLVVQVLRGNRDTIVTDVVSSVANNKNLGSRNRSESLVPISITEGHDYNIVSTITSKS